MLRMTFVVCVLTIVSSGCQCFDYAIYNVSLATARVESLGPGCHRSRDACGECNDCIPHRPFTHGYIPHHDFCITQQTAQRCAFNDLAAYKAQCGRRVSHHFKMGFIAAYEDIALNRQPAPPIIPPPKYWNAYYRSPAGRPCVDDWFAGYHAGRQAGLSSGVSQFNQIYLNRFGGANGPVDPQYDAQAPYCDQPGQDPYDPVQSQSAPTQYPAPRPITPVGFLFSRHSP